MESIINQDINKRFFQALDNLKTIKAIRGIQTFAREHNIDRRTMYNIKTNPQTQRIKTEWLHYIVTDFNISAEWLLTGRGSMFK